MEQVSIYLSGLTLTDTRNEFEAKVEEIEALFIRNFGEEHVTHYMVNLSTCCCKTVLLISSNLKLEKEIWLSISLSVCSKPS